MADKSFGIKELNLIGASGTPTITSPNNLNLNAGTVAISTDVTVGRHLDVDGHAEFDNVKITGVTTFSGEGITKFDANGSLFFNDASLGANSTGKIYFGDSNDLQIYHDGTNSQIYESGSGSLRITTSKLELRSAGGEEMGNFYTDGAVELYYNNSKKFETAGSGINVVGTTTTGQLSVSGVSTFLSAINVSSSYGTSGQVLTSQGSGSAPQWATPAAAGKILQVVTTDYTGLFSTSTDNTWTQVSSLDCTINLASSSSKVLIIVSLGQVSSANDVGSAWDIRRDGTAILQGVSDGSRIPCTFKVGCYQPSHASAATFTGIDSPGSSGSKTYQIYCRSQGGTTLYLNRTNNNEDASDTYAARPASHLTLMEIAS